MTEETKAVSAAPATADVKEKPKPSPKKRKRPATGKKAKNAKGAPPVTATPPPTSILIIDNGGDSVKYGWAKDEGEPQSMPNVTSRLRYQINTLVGDEIETVKPNQLESTTRSMERGHINNMGNQIQVWKRIMDKLGISNSNSTPASGGGEAAQAFGWKKARNTNSPTPPLIQSRTISVLLLIQPHCPRILIDLMMQVWMEDLGVSHVGFGISGSFAAVSYNKKQQEEKTLEFGDTGCCCVIDAGWSSTHVLPTYKGKVLDGIRRVSLGGRHLLNLWRYYVSYRQWNLMDQEWILRDVHHRLAFFSMDFAGDMKLARRVPLGKRPWDRDYVLPDMQTTTQGEIRLAAGLQRAIDEEKSESKVSTEQTEDDDDEDDEDHNGEDSSDDSDDDSDEEESEEAIRQRIMRQRQEDERRRREMEAEQQVLSVSVERFTIPEVLFTPADASLPNEMAGLPQAIVQSIGACPPIYRAALYLNVHLTGGVAHITNFQQRLERELRSLAPSQYQVRVTTSDDPKRQAWLGARDWVRQSSSNTRWSVSRDEWEASKKDTKKPKCWHQLLIANGGIYS